MIGQDGWHYRTINGIIRSTKIQTTGKYCEKRGCPLILTPEVALLGRALYVVRCLHDRHI